MQSGVRERRPVSERRQQILDEASRLIGERGYYGFGLRELGMRCELGNAGLLHHFGSKEGLLIALLEDRDARDRHSLGLSQLNGGSGTPNLDDLRALMRAAMVRNCSQPELIRLYAILQAEALNEEHPAFHYFCTRETNFLDQLAPMLSAHVPEPRSTARQLLALMLGLEQQWLRSGQTIDLIAEWDCAMASLLPHPSYP